MQNFPQPRIVFALNQSCLSMPRFAQTLPNMEHIPNHWPMQRFFFFYFWNRPWYSDESVLRLHYIPFLDSLGLFNIYLKQKQSFSVWNFTENTSFISFYEGIWTITKTHWKCRFQIDSFNYNKVVCYTGYSS